MIRAWKAMASELGLRRYWQLWSVRGIAHAMFKYMRTLLADRLAHEALGYWYEGQVQQPGEERKRRASRSAGEGSDEEGAGGEEQEESGGDAPTAARKRRVGQSRQAGSAMRLSRTSYKLFSGTGLCRMLSAAMDCT